MRQASKDDEVAREEQAGIDKAKEGIKVCERGRTRDPHDQEKARGG